MMSAQSLHALGGPVWIEDRTEDRPSTMSPLPIIILVCGLVAPVLLSRLDLPAPALSDHASFDRRYFWAETQSITPLLASAQIKRVAASRNVPYFVVRRLVDENSRGTKGVDVAALNRALDQYGSAK